MTETKMVKNLKRGDMVVLVTGESVEVLRSERPAIFEGDCWEIETAEGSAIYGQNDLVEVSL